jgi:hypothetical protein
MLANRRVFQESLECKSTSAKDSYPDGLPQSATLRRNNQRKTFIVPATNGPALFALSQ